MKTTFEQELNDILGWWVREMTDLRSGGFYGRIDGEGTLHPEAEKGIILNTRILWTFSAAARSTGNPDWQQAADRAFHYIASYFYDPEYQGVYWSLDHLGAPAQTKKQSYAQAFAIYALSEYYLLTRSPESLHLAQQIFSRLETHALDKVRNGYLEAFTREWGAMADIRLSDKDANEAKTQNTHLHILEAYTNLCRCDNSAPVKDALRNLIFLFTDKFIDPESAHIHLFFDEEWSLRSDIVSYGHDIEASWLLWEAAEVLDEAAVKTLLKPICLRIAEVTLKEATEADGAVINEYYPSQQRYDRDRIWWVQAEAMVGFWNAWQLSGETRYREAALRTWNYILDNQRDTVGGEWFWNVSAEGIPSRSEDKAGFWKCPYHNGRALMEMIRRA
ncbi:MAG: N-acyl-D-glucosamine 2-epimerase [Bacteroidetes bacterium]|nr:MAG: N-acyl-D-glucosamine 2-epimerase [Bacteroidota bacterium]